MWFRPRARGKDDVVRHVIEAVERSQAVIEFDPRGTILRANELFLRAVGYRRDEVEGQHHRMFVDVEYAASAEYRTFWDDLRAGKFCAGEFRRVKKGGGTLWLQASYNPILDDNGVVVKIVKLAADITDRAARAADSHGQILAIRKSQAVIEFLPDGTILDANENFLAVVGYDLSQIVGKHHRMFVDAQFAETAEYRDFWRALASGNFRKGEFRRVARDGGEVWLEASYNPVADASGRIVKVVKFASDVTRRKHLEQVLFAVDETATSLSRAADHLLQLSRDLAGAAAETSRESTEVSSAAEEVSAGAQSVASSVEQLSASIREITRNVAEASKVAAQAVSASTHTAETVSKLGASSARIGQMLSVITSIADRTSLLALNATIEAAHAGDAGRGFAVVAAEVKELARSTTEATSEITAVVDAIQEDVQGTVRVVDSILAVVTRLAEISSAIAAAVEQQSMTTNEIARTVSDSAKASGGIAGSIAAVAKTADRTSAGVQGAGTAAAELGKMAATLQSVLAESRAAMGV